MVSSRKRTLQEAGVSPPEEPSLLNRIRNQWQFANLCQWIFLFGKVVKIDDSLDVEEIEAECLKPNAPILQDIGLALLKFISSHRGLTYELFDEYTRRQYLAKAPEQNPFGTGEVAARFVDFDVLKKLQILQQLTQWVMIRPDRIREKMEEQKDIDQTSWRIEPIGWDRDDRTYFVLDDNRVYRLTDPGPKSVIPKKPRVAKYGSRSKKRLRTSAATRIHDPNQSENELADAGAYSLENDGLGGLKWECIAISLEEVQGLVASFHKTKDDNEKVLRDQLQAHLLPVLEKQEESRKRKELQREKVLQNLAKMANAKRSSRIANKAEQQKQEETAKLEAKILQAQQIAERKEEQRRHKLEKERDSRQLSRENRVKEREARRMQHERELSQLSEDNCYGSGRSSERRLQAEIDRNKRALQELDDERDDWIFDCICGVYGQIDDGTHSIACEKCNVWQHSKCVGIRESDAEKSEFHFICRTCGRHAEEAAAKPRTTIKLKVNRPSDTSSPANKPSKAASPRPFPSSLTVERSSHLKSTRQLAENGKLASYRLVDKTDVRNRLPKSRCKMDGLCLSQGAVNGAQPRSTSVSGISGQSNQTIGTLSAKERSAESTTSKFEDDKTDNRSARVSNGKTMETADNELLSSPMRHDATNSPLGASSPRLGGTNLMATPIINREQGIPGSAQSSFALPSAEGGLSPTKHSPPLPRPQPPSLKTPSLPAVLPPVATLSPSPRQQILTPPVKSADPARRSQA